MSIDELIQLILDTINRRTVGQPDNQDTFRRIPTMEHLVRLIWDKLSSSTHGQLALTALRNDPTNSHQRSHAAAVVKNDMETDAKFAQSVQQAAQAAGIVVQGLGSASHSPDYQGNVNMIQHARNVKLNNKRFHIGSIRFGTGGLATCIAVVVIGVGGGTAAVIANNSATQVSLGSIVGKWQQTGAISTSMISLTPAVLTVSPDGHFTYKQNVTESVPGMSPPSGFASMPTGIVLNVDCNGTVEANGDHFTFHSTAGMCQNFDVVLNHAGTVLDMESVVGDNKSVSLAKVN